MSYIIIRNLSKSYINRRAAFRHDNFQSNTAEIKVLDNLNLEFFSGEMVCILGASGCGKSTLLRIIAGFERSSTGSVMINKEVVCRPSGNHVFVFQHNGLLPWMTVAENVQLGVRNLADKQARVDKVQEYIDMVELTGFEQHYGHQLSGGMQRRAELARALVVNPEMLIMDEPFSGLDFLTHMRIREEVANLHQFLGKTMILVTHDIMDALVLADRIVVLSGRPAQVKWEHKLDFPHPRDVEREPGLLELRDELFFMLGVNYAV